ncbi:MAG TPA: DUF1513 domain-containing protein [Bauldia sp.]|nr:DUF1513 domain-containing protein [Bauldia sp.]
MATDRRSFLRSLAALGALPFTTLARADAEPAFVAARMERANAFSVVVLDHAGNLLFTEELDARAHDIAVSPYRTTAVVFARRPGRFAVVVDLAGRRKLTTFAPPEGRHFYGHGFFSADGRLLYATENDWEGERGVLGVYDVDRGYARIGEFETGGIDPHEAFLMSDGRTIAVANGGIATHPDFDRVKLNLATMEPSLTYLDAGTGDLLERVALPVTLHQLSLRHMAEAADRSIWFGGQYEGAATDSVDLVGRHRRGGMLELIPAPPSAYGGMRQYVGSVAASRDGMRIAATSPVGGRMLIFETARRSLIATRDIADVCGVAGEGRDFFTSDGRGRLWRGETLLSEDPAVAWDNHLRRIG